MMGPYTGIQITFLNRSKPSDKSWNVSFPAGKEVRNGRGPHVETEVEGLAGKKYTLGERQVKQIGGNMSVMYIVDGLNNGRFPAHTTVYFGPKSGSEKY